MVLKTLLEKLNYEVTNGNDNIEINKLMYDSRYVTQGDVFVCIVGAVSDGHEYISDVAAKGAAAVIVQNDVEITEELKTVTIIRLEDTRLALAYMSAAYFGYPAKELFTIGITGTKGKTTTTYMVRDILESCNIRTGLIGTIHNIIGDEVIPSANTTPESYKLHEYFRRMVDKGCRCVVIEVSSQALMLHRTAGVEFDIGVFTNLEPDHIGPNEHSSFEDYMACKNLLFRQCKTGIVNIDCEHTEEVLKGHTCEIETYGLNGKAQLTGHNISYSFVDGNLYTDFDTKGCFDMHVKLSLPGVFSVYNGLCALAIIKHLTTEEKLIKQALFNARVPGRVEPVDVSDEFTVMIDYAHNAMALESLLSTFKEYNPSRIVTVFGCGGDRSKIRRYEMGEISGRMSDFTIITSDNPRSEEPSDIMKDIETGIRKTDGKYIMIEDRGEAVKYAVQNGQKGDIIVVAGKGHEDYQEIKGVKHHMTDRELIENAVKE